MIIYEVTATVRADLAEKYEKYLRERHIPDLLETNCFSGARFLRAGENRFRTEFEARDAPALENYLENYAPLMRADFAAHFPEGVELSRENWEVLQAWRGN